MKATTNLYVQLTALAVFVVLRFAAPGLILVFFVVTVIGPVLVALPTVMAWRHRRADLSWPVVALSGATAACLVVAGALVYDTDDQHDYFPAVELLARGTAVDHDTQALLMDIGGYATFGFLVGVVLTAMALAGSDRTDRTVAG